MDFGVLTFVTDEGIRPAALGKALEERGFESLFIAEHSHIPVKRETPYPDGGEMPKMYYRTLDPFVTLTAAAAVTTDLRLGTGVVLQIQRDVIHTAKEVASLDLVSGGRVLFGIGAGWNREEMRNHGTDPRKRGALLNEQLAALKEIWANDEAEFHGEHVDFDPIFQWPKPVQTPHPPIYVGGDSPAALNRLAAYGNAWFPSSQVTPERIREVRAELADKGRTDVEFTIPGFDLGALDAYAEAGVNRIVHFIEDLPEDQMLRKLDELAKYNDR
ncbi:LLM class F420-dependent oxidoreductase [Amycolatopsis anabasis]|uniref:LLM class F420-dependent oxidoreductase n=1 Tax=Amycolatopsis anabasis TaxID=1840409 RepID=UPI00131D5D4A|nr:LLM class F420-dependent oxidoreductase [Amycolatopsis anabasis]